jgi:hypothetical protein
MTKISGSRSTTSAATDHQWIVHTHIGSLVLKFFNPFFNLGSISQFGLQNSLAAS